MSREEIKEYDISNEASRWYEYTFFGVNGGFYRELIENPVSVFMGKGHVFHRVWDGEEVHLCHAPGPIWGDCGKVVGICTVSWVPEDSKNPCRW